MIDKSKTNNKYYIVKLYFFYLCSVLVLYYSQIETYLFLLLAGSISLIVFSIIIYKEFKSSEIKFTPISLLSFSLFLMMGIGSIYQSVDIKGLDYFTFSTAYISITSLKTGYLMIVIGVFFQLIGLVIFRPIKHNYKLKKFEYSKLKLYTIFLLVLFITKIFSIAFLGMISNFLNALPIAVLSYVVFANKESIKLTYKEKRNFILFGSSTLFLFNIILLSKLALIYSLFPIVFFYIYKRKNQKKIIILFAFLSILYFGFVQPFVSNTRILLLKQRVELSYSFLFDYIQSGEYLYNIEAYPDQKNNYEEFLSRLFEIGAPAFIYETAETQGFQYGKDFYYMFIGIVPRFIWPDKPSIPRGAIFAQTYLGQTGVSIGMSIAGELYLNFGWLGIVVGYFALGSLIGYFWQLLGTVPTNNLMSFTFYILLLFSSIAGAEFGSVFLGIAQLIIMFFVFRLIQKEILIRSKER